MNRARTSHAKEQRRQALLDAALDEFFEKGYTAARMDDIASRAGVSKGTVYLYFKSKEQVFHGLINSIASPKIQELEAVLHSAGSAKEALQMLFRIMPMIVAHSPMPKLAKVLIGDCNGFPEVVCHYRQQVIDRGIGAITQLLEAGKRSGELQVVDADLTARLVIAPMIYAAIWRVVFEIGVDQPLNVEALFELHGSMIIKALSAD